MHVPVSLATLAELTTKREVIQTDWRFVTCYGVRHRTVDYVENIRAKMLQAVIPEKVLGSFPIKIASLEISRLVCMKIGGLPMLFYSPEERADLYELPGRLLCSLATIWPMHEQSYPWINRPSPYALGDGLSPELHLDIRDGFILFMSIDDDKVMHWALQVY